MNDATVRRLLALEEEYAVEDRDDLVDQPDADFPDAAFEIVRGDAA